MEHVIHQIPPVFNHQSEILILGSFPSVKSREAGFFYHHLRFISPMRLPSSVEEESGESGCSLPETVEDKKIFLLKHHIAVWDVIASCDIHGSSDSSIKNAVPNDFSHILKAAPVRQIYTNGGTAFQLYKKYCEPVTGCPAVRLPSTSPANASYSLERLLEAWKVILPS